MAEADGEIRSTARGDGEGNELRYLGFVPVAVIWMLAHASTLYEHVKERSGPFKGGVARSEVAAKAMLGPLFQKLRDSPFSFLIFADTVLGHVVDKLDGHVPALVWEVFAAVRAVPASIGALARDAQRVGVVQTTSALAKDAMVRCEPKARELYVKYEPKARELYLKYEPVAEQCAVVAWRRFNALPLFPQVAQIAVPTAAYLVEKYNGAVAYGREKGYVAAVYVPLVPVGRIAKVFGSPGTAEAVGGHGPEIAS